MAQVVSWLESAEADPFSPVYTIFVSAGSAGVIGETGGVAAGLSLGSVRLKQPLFLWPKNYSLYEFAA